MSRTLKEATISTPKARSRLTEGVHWRGIDSDVHLGYRKGKRAGRWLVRWYIGDQRYQQETIGAADDAPGIEANGIDCLSFDQAKAAASALVTEKRAQAIAAAEGPMQTVRTAAQTYIKIRDEREIALAGEDGRKRDASQRLKKHVLSDDEFSDTPLHELKERHLTKWLDGLPGNLAATTVRRITNDLKAALNAAATKHRSRLPAEIFVIIKNGLASDISGAPTARDKQALPDADIRRIINAAKQIDEAENWDGDLYRMVLVLAATGARFSQVRRATISDLQPDQQRLMVPVSHKGRGTKKVSHIAVNIGQDVITALLPETVKRRPSDPLLERWRHKQVSNSGGRPVWERDRRAAWFSAAELTRPWNSIVEQAGLADDIVPYALRHSSIVRQLRSGLPVRLVAALHDTSAEMIERHYSAAITDALDQLAAGAVIPLVETDADKVVRLRG